MPDLPYLLYLGDVPIEATYHGSLLLYRLLERYPANKLSILEAGQEASAPERRLRDVRYQNVAPAGVRLLRTRFHHEYATFLLWTQGWRLQKMRRESALHGIEGVLTVAHGFSWIAAARFARRYDLPLHLIVHDDWPHTTRVSRGVKAQLNTMFAHFYRQAASRFCVSPFMEKEYKTRYDVSGLVLYPSRGFNVKKYSCRPARVMDGDVGLKFAFAGTINSGGYARVLAHLAEELSKTNGELVVYGPHTFGSLEYWGLDQPNVRPGGWLNPGELLDHLRREVDVLFAPMSFEDVGERENMELSFPSKLADYTAVGLPLLICGPRYCSAVKWADDYSPVAEVVFSEDRAELAQAISRLQPSQHRQFLAERALAVGERLFSHVEAERTFFSALAQSIRGKPRRRNNL